MRRIELLTPCLQGRCSPSWATPPYKYFFGLFLSITSLKLLDIHAYCLRPFALYWKSCVRQAISPGCSLWFLLAVFSPDRYFSQIVLLTAAYFVYAREWKSAGCGKLVGLSGLEPPTSRLSGVRSNRLSYRPMQGFYGFFSLSCPTFFIFFFLVFCWTPENKQYSVLSTNRIFE